MKKLIFFPGNIKSSFVQNELSYYKCYFDEVVIFDYGKDIQNLNDICDNYGFKGYSIKHAARMKPYAFFKWLRSNEVWGEICENIDLSLLSIKKILYIFYYGYYYLKFEKIIRKEISGFEGEVYLYSYWLTKSAYTVAKFSKFDRNKIKNAIARAHGYDLYLERNSMHYLPFRKFIEHNLDSIAFISQQGCEYFKKSISSRERGTFKAKQCVNRLGTFNIGDICKKELNKSKIIIASCSSIISLKRLDLIIEVISKVTKVKVEWMHIGEGIEADKIKKLAKRKLPIGNYKFLGKVKNEKILNIYSKYNVDFFINLSDTEGIPVSIMEALSIGIPIIARNVGGVSEIVTKETGVLLDEIWTKKEAEKAVAFIEEIDEDSYKKLSASCVHKWNELYNADNNYRKFFTEMVK